VPSLECPMRTGDVAGRSPAYDWQSCRDAVARDRRRRPRGPLSRGGRRRAARLGSRPFGLVALVGAARRAPERQPPGVPGRSPAATTDAGARTDGHMAHAVARCGRHRPCGLRRPLARRALCCTARRATLEPRPAARPRRPCRRFVRAWSVPPRTPAGPDAVRHPQLAADGSSRCRSYRRHRACPRSQVRVPLRCARRAVGGARSDAPRVGRR
jgi:hypothetical protein